MRPMHRSANRERGVSLIELMIALVVLSLGILAVGQLFPSGSRGQLQDRMMTTAAYYAQEQLERLQDLSWTDPDLALGPHPATPETLGDSGQWHRTWLVESMPAPMDNLRRVTVTVSWSFLGAHQATVVTYVRR